MPRQVQQQRTLDPLGAWTDAVVNRRLIDSAARTRCHASALFVKVSGYFLVACFLAFLLALKNGAPNQQDVSRGKKRRRQDAHCATFASHADIRAVVPHR
jgi:hypothetical protein